MELLFLGLNWKGSLDVPTSQVREDNSGAQHSQFR